MPTHVPTFHSCTFRGNACRRSLEERARSATKTSVRTAASSTRLGSAVSAHVSTGRACPRSCSQWWTQQELETESFNGDSPGCTLHVNRGWSLLTIASASLHYSSGTARQAFVSTAVGRENGRSCTKSSQHHCVSAPSQVCGVGILRGQLRETGHEGDCSLGVMLLDKVPSVLVEKRKSSRTLCSWE